MPSIRRRAESNSILYRIRDDDGCEQQRSCCVGPTESLEEGLAFYKALLRQAESDILAAGRKWWIVRDADRIAADAADRIAAIERAQAEIDGDA